MNCKELITILEQTYPTQVAAEWDNTGFLCGRLDKEIKKVYIAVDLTDTVISHAISCGADLIITHHPMLFAPVRKVTDEDIVGRRLLRLLQNDICCYAMHTNYDVLRMAELAKERLSIKDAEVLEEGFGCVGELSNEMTLEECCQLVKDKFQIPSVKIFGKRDALVKRVAVLPGSGKSMIGSALERGADVYISGDIDHHTGVDTVEEGMCIIDAGHYGLEYIFMEDMKEFLHKHVNGISVETEQVEFPFENI